MPATCLHDSKARFTIIDYEPISMKCILWTPTLYTIIYVQYLKVETEHITEYAAVQ